LKSSITSEDREIILSVLFNDPHIFGYIRNTWSLRSLAKCLTKTYLSCVFNRTNRTYYCRVVMIQ
ncbi:MAG: hypothetical protein WAM14_04830, partial [Candidatus Nitrosopolaris sp.]